MDIAKYIGLYLLKNKFCYIHGLGNLELRKKSSVHDGQAIQGPEYEVTLTQGSIDDSLANFIATHEQTSISKAANCLRDFSSETRAALQEGKEVAIPSIGKFVEQSGIIRFITDPHLAYTPPSIPILRTAKRLEDAPSFKSTAPDEDTFSRAGGISGKTIGIALAAIAVVVLIVFLGMKFMGNNNNQPATPPATVENTTPVVPQQPADMSVPDTTVRDTVAMTAPTTMSATPATGGPTKVILGTYPTRMAAERRVKTLTNNGNTVELAAKDSTSYYVVMPITFAPADSARVLDSLRRMFNPKGVSIYR